MTIKVFINKGIGKIGRMWYENNHINWIATIYFNLRQLTFIQAIKLPVFVYWGTNLIDLSGSIIFKCPIKRGMVHLGKKWTRSQGYTIFLNRGIWEIEGKVIICKGTHITIAPSAILCTGNSVRIRENCYIAVNKSVSIGNNSAIAYSSQILDSDFHYIIDVNTRQCQYNKAPIVIGNNNWIGSYTTIKKGTITPNYCIVASSYSVLSKDYTKNIPEFSIIGGIPAKLIVSGKRRVFSMTSQSKLYDYFLHSNNIFVLTENENIEKFCN